MRLTVIQEDTGHKETSCINYVGKLIDCIPKEYINEIDLCFVDGVRTNDLEQVYVDYGTNITLYIKPPGHTAAIFVAKILISAIISIVLSKITQALFGKKPRKPKIDLPRIRTRAEESPTYAFEGIQDTIAGGSPIPFILGVVRKGGQVISTRVELYEDGKKQRLFMLLCMGHGQVSSIEDVEINGTKITSYSKVTYDWRDGKASGNTVMSDFEKSVDQTYYDGRDFTDASITYTTKGEVERLDLFVSALSGISHNTDTGDFLENKSTYKIEYRAQTSAGEPWTTETSTATVKGRTTNAKYSVYNLILPAKDVYEVRLTWLSATYTDESKDAWRLSLHNVVESVDETRTYDGYALLGISAISTPQLNGRLPNVTAIVKGMVRNFYDILVHTENNALNIREILRNSVWGLGHRLPNSMFEQSSWTTFRDYCDTLVDAQGGGQEVRHKISYVGDKKIKGWDLVNDLLAMCDASLILSEGKLKVVIDQAQTPTQLYSEANTVQGTLSITYARAERRINTVSGKFFDEDEGYKSNFVKVEDTTALATEQAKVEDLDLIGVTRQSEAIRVSKRHLKENVYRKKTFNWESPFDAIVSEPGDLVRRQYYLSDFSKGYSGYVLGGNTIEVFLDRVVTLAVGKTYEIYIRHKTKNTFVTGTIASPAGNYGKVVVTSALTLSAAEGDLWVISEQTVGYVDVLLEQVTQKENGNFILSGVNYDSNVYTLDALPSKAQRNRARVGDVPPLPIENWTVREGKDVLPDGTVNAFLEFDITPGAIKNAGTCTGATASTISLSSDEPTRLDYFINAKIQILQGTGAGQTRTILAYDGNIQKVTSLSSNWDTVPDTTSEYEIDFVKAGEYFGSIVEISDSDQVDWFEFGRITGTSGTLSIRGQGQEVYIRLIPYTATDKRNERSLLVKSITTSGKDVEPSNVNNFSVVQINDVLLFSWTRVSDLDIDLYEIRAGVSWYQSRFVGDSKQDFLEITQFAPTTYIFFIKAKDRTGNYSVTAASYTITTTQPNSRQIYNTVDELATLSGVFDGIAIRELATSYGNGLSLAASGKWDVSGNYWDTALSSVSASQPVESWDGATVLVGTYVTPAYDIGAIAFARIFADIGFQDSQDTTLIVEEQHSDDNITYSSWRLIGAGDQKWRYAKLRITLSVPDSLTDPVINKFDVIIDAKVRIYRGIGVTVPTGAGGTSVTFDTSYIQTPAVHVTEHNQAPIVYLSSPSKTGFTLKHDGGGTSTVDWRSEGI